MNSKEETEVEIIKKLYNIYCVELRERDLDKHTISF
jgi:hypothetical protein